MDAVDARRAAEARADAERERAERYAALLDRIAEDELTVWRRAAAEALAADDQHRAAQGEGAVPEWGRDLLPGTRIKTPTGRTGIITRPGGTPDVDSWRVRFDDENGEREWRSAWLRRAALGEGT